MIRKFILGTAQMGLDYGVNNHSGQITVDDSYAIFLKAFESGIEILDTAEAYGNAHRLIGDFHRLNPNLKFKIMTKIPDYIEYDKVAQKIYTYCEILQVDCLEVLMFHSFELYRRCKENLNVLELLKDKGVINNIGVSVYTNDHIEELLSDDRISVVQLPYNLLDNATVRGNLLKKLKSKGKMVHTRSCFLQGLFFKSSSENNRIYKALSEELESIKQIVKDENTTMTNLALSYCLNQNSIDNVLIGVDSLCQLEENLRAIDFAISVDGWLRINSLKVKNTDLLNPSLWTKLR